MDNTFNLTELKRRIWIIINKYFIPGRKDDYLEDWSDIIEDEPQNEELQELPPEQMEIQLI